MINITPLTDEIKFNRTFMKTIKITLIENKYKKNAHYSKIKINTKSENNLMISNTIRKSLLKKILSF